MVPEQLRNLLFFTKTKRKSDSIKESDRSPNYALWYFKTGLRAAVVSSIRPTTVVCGAS